MEGAGEKNTRVIWKFPLPDDDTFTLDIPVKAWVLHVAVQAGIPTMWCMVNPQAKKAQVEFLRLGTGRVISKELVNECIYLGTFQLLEGYLVWHLFAKGDIVC